jgi:hypothetical protein
MMVKRSKAHGQAEDAAMKQARIMDWLALPGKAKIPKNNSLSFAQVARA